MRTMRLQGTKQQPRPDPGFAWVEGYWYTVGKHYKWHEGYWTRPPYERARWVAPHHDGEHYYAGYWEGDRGLLNTITTRIAVETAISKILVIMTTVGTTDSEQLKLKPRIARLIQYDRTAASYR
jgi:hypothetical protein